MLMCFSVIQKRVRHRIVYVKASVAVHCLYLKNELLHGEVVM